MRILILEDNLDRRQAMTICLKDRFPQYPVEFFATSAAMIKCLTAGIDDVAMISLDHDLELIPEPDGQLLDPGTGVEVSDWLVAQTPGCPVIVQTTNSRAGDQMEDSLRDSGWTVQRIVPYSGEDWIYETWSRAVRDLIVNEIPKPVRQQIEPTAFRIESR